MTRKPLYVTRKLIANTIRNILEGSNDLSYVNYDKITSLLDNLVDFKQKTTKLNIAKGEADYFSEYVNDGENVLKENKIKE